MLRLLPRMRQKFWMLLGVLLISLPAVLLLFYFRFDLHSADYRQWAYIHSRLYRHYLWHQADEADRVKQHNTVDARVQAAGGWTALQRDCDALVKTNRDGVFIWDKWTDTNALPPAIAALQPMEVMYYSPRVLRDWHINTEFSIVRINITFRPP